MNQGEMMYAAERLPEVEAENARLRAALMAVLLFHRPEWTPERQAEWEALTGENEPSTRTLCDMARRALGITDGKEDCRTE